MKIYILSQICDICSLENNSEIDPVAILAQVAQVTHRMMSNTRRLKKRQQQVEVGSPTLSCAPSPSESVDPSTVMEHYLEGDVPILNTRSLFTHVVGLNLASGESPLDSGVKTMNALISKLTGAERRKDWVLVASLTKAIRDAGRAGHVPYTREDETEAAGEPVVRKFWLTHMAPKIRPSGAVNKSIESEAFKSLVAKGACEMHPLPSGLEKKELNA